MANVDIYQMTTKDTNHKVAPVTIFDAVVNPLNKKTLDQEFEDMVGAVDENVALDNADETLVTTALRKTNQVLTLAEQKQSRTNIGAASATDLTELSTTVSENKTETDGKLTELARQLMSGKTISIVGASTSTYKNYSSEPYYYPAFDVDSVDKTWWYKFIVKNSGIFKQNLSISGARVTNTRTDIPSLVNQVNSLEICDVLLLAGGYNDKSNHVDIGVIDFTKDITELNDSVFAEAYDHYVRLALEKAKMVVCIIIKGISGAYKNVIKQIANHYSIPICDFTPFDIELSQSVHPSYKGMMQMAEILSYALSIYPVEFNMIIELSHITGINNVVTSIIPEIEGYGLYYGPTYGYDELLRPIRQGGSNRLSTPLYYFTDGTIKISANFSKGYQIALQCYGLKKQIFDTSWYSEAIERDINGLMFCITIKKVVDGTDVTLEDVTLEDVGLTIEVLQPLKYSLSSMAQLENLNKNFNDNKKETDTNIQSLELESNNITSVLSLEKVSYNPIDGLYDIDGGVVSYTRGYHTPPLKVNKGDIIYSPKIYPIKSFVSQVSETGEWIKRIDDINSSATYIKYSKIIEEDMYVSLSYYVTANNEGFVPDLFIRRSYPHTELISDSIQRIYATGIISDKKDFVLTENKYVMSNGGFAVPSTVKLNMYTIPTNILNSINTLYVKVRHEDTIPIAIAFYSGEPSPSTFMINDSIRSIKGDNIYNVSVPAFAKYAIISYLVGYAEPTIIGYTNVTKAESLVIAGRESNIVSSSINDIIDLSGFESGTQFCLKFGEISKTTFVYLRGANEIDLHTFSVRKGQPDIYFEKTEAISSLQLWTSAAEGNNVEYELSITTKYNISKRVQNSYIYKGNAISFNIGNGFHGYWTTPTTISNTLTWICYPIQYSNGYTIKISCTDFSVYYVALKIWKDDFSSYEETLITEEYLIDLSDVAAWHIQFRRIDRAALDLEQEKNTINVEYVSGDIWERPSTKHELDKVSNKVDEQIKAITNLAFNPFRNNPYYAHYAANGFINDGNGNNVIASESVEDIEMAARLGFGFIEANIHKNASGDFVCIHGDTGSNPVTFGKEVIDISNGNLGSNIAISEATTEYMDENIRYNSQVEKYRTKVPTLERFLMTCKENNIGIFAGTNNKDAIDMCIQYLGKDNVIVYNPPSNIRDYFNGYIFTWNNNSSIAVETLMSNADKYGIPYMCGIGPSLLTKLKTDGTLDSFIKAMHEKGYLIGIAAVYQTEEDVRDCFRRGMDFASAGHEVNPFTHNYEIFDLDADTSQFTTNGTIVDNVATLSNGNTIECASNDIISIGKGYLTIKFSGTIIVSFGSVGNRTITSDGTQNIVVSDYFLRNDTHLKITAQSDVVITSMVYKTSKC